MRIGIALLVAIAALVPGTASADPACDADPGCNQGRGHIAGYACWRNEASPLPGNAFNGRVCVEHPDGGDEYLYTRGLTNREPVVWCRDGHQVFPDPPPDADDTYVCGPM